MAKKKEELKEIKKPVKNQAKKAAKKESLTKPSNSNVKKSTKTKAAAKPNTAKSSKKVSSKAPVKSYTKKSSTPKKAMPKVKIFSLGGLNEIGKNITCIECENDIIVIDCGIGFPDDDMLGVDLVIPDFTYLINNVDKIRGVFITHGHEDHIGSLPYLLRAMNVPVFGTRLSLGIVENKLTEHKLLQSAKLNTVSAGDKVSAGCFKIEFIVFVAIRAR